jgi:hypothetical protein
VQRVFVVSLAEPTSEESSAQFKGQALRVGQWEYPDLEEGLTITAETLLAIKKAFDDRVKGPVAPLNLEHDDDRPVGWVKGLELSDDGQALYALFEITEPDIREKVKNGTYRYLSSELLFNWRDPETKQEYDVLDGLALTVRPYIKNMDPIRTIDLAFSRWDESKHQRDEKGRFAKKAVPATDDSDSQDSFDPIEPPKVPKPTGTKIPDTEAPDIISESSASAPSISIPTKSGPESQSPAAQTDSDSGSTSAQDAAPDASAAPLGAAPSGSQAGTSGATVSDPDTSSAAPNPDPDPNASAGTSADPGQASSSSTDPDQGSQNADPQSDPNQASKSSSQQQATDTNADADDDVFGIVIPKIGKIGSSSYKNPTGINQAAQYKSFDDTQFGSSRNWRVNGDAVNRMVNSREKLKSAAQNKMPSVGGWATKETYTGGTVLYKDSNGKLHRTNGPAYIGKDGTQASYYNGILHREGGAAFISGDGQFREWYKNGFLHNTDGPAQIYHGISRYFVNGREMSPSDYFKVYGRPTKERAASDTKNFIKETFPGGTKIYKNRQGKIDRAGGPAYIGADGTVMWFQNGLLARPNDPAVFGSDGSKLWYKAGKLHRNDGPAVEKADGTQMYYQEGELHREDGPAVIKPDNSMEWWVKGNKVKETKGASKSKPQLSENNVTIGDMPDKLNNVDTVNEIAIELEEARARAAALLAENRAIKTQFELERIKRRLSDLGKKRRGAVTVHMSKRIVSLAEALLKNGKSVIKLEEPAPIYLEDDERPEMTDEIDIIEEVIDMLEEVVESVEGSSSDESESYGEELEKPGTGDWDDDLEEEAKAILSQKPELKLRDAYVLAELKLTEKRKGVLKNGR